MTKINPISNPCFIGHLTTDNTVLNVVNININEFIHKNDDEPVWVVIYYKNPVIKQVIKKDIIITGVESVNKLY
jgi:hypothetical protein